MNVVPPLTEHRPVALPPRPAAAAPAAQGLSSAQALRELERIGPNVLAEGEGPHWLARFARNFTNLFALLLWAGRRWRCSGARPSWRSRSSS